MTRWEEFKRAVELINSASIITAFTGAGISVESGIPPFRGAEGIWNSYDPSVLELDRYLEEPDESWPVIHDLFYQFFDAAKPNPAHDFLVYLEQQGKLKAVITQNIDNLHQEAGNSRVVEFHGNSKWMICTHCGERKPVSEMNISYDVPRCSTDNGLMKPDFVFFGEAIPERASSEAFMEAERADLLLLIGSLGEVMPAGMIPGYAKNFGCTIIEINTERSRFTDTVTDVYLKGKAGEVCEQLRSSITVN